MCIGIPMQVLRVTPGRALCAGRGEQREIGTVLVGDVAPGDWLLVFLESARERITAARAAEVNAVLDLVSAAVQGADASEPDFALPSAMDPRQLVALTGSPLPALTES